MRQHAKTIDSGSGYLCQMEPIAHYGLREGEVISHITIKWTNGEETKHQIEELNTVYTIGQTKNEQIYTITTILRTFFSFVVCYLLASTPRILKLMSFHTNN